MTNIFLFIVLPAALVLAFVSGMICLVFIQKRRGAKAYKDEEHNLDIIYGNLVNYFREEKPYLNPNLDVKEVAATIFTNRTYLARAIKKHGMINFNYFMNSFRVNEALEIFRKDPGARIGETGAKCGFNTTSSFTMVFKAFLNKTPKEWKLRHNAKPFQAYKSGRQTKQVKKDKEGR